MKNEVQKLIHDRKSEAAFETVIESYLLEHGYQHLTPPYDKETALFPNEVLAFIQATQPQEWAKIAALQGANTGQQIIKDLVQWLNTQGVLATLRHGFKSYGRSLRIAFFKPAHGLNNNLENLYAANRLGIMRQLHYSQRDSQKSLDVVLTLNGIPIATLELKNPMTGQTYKDATKQYRENRDPRELLFEFKKRTLVHFAVDPNEVWMSSRLGGNATHFLPFNRGNHGAAGNPVALPNSYSTAYLWEEVLQTDSLLDLCAAFIHLQEEERLDDKGRKYKKESLIFPRYHQLQAVRALVADVREQGIGHNYLIEHSAGSGKSNTIAWLAHRLASLHNDHDEKIFDSVIVITDRRVLDSQLQKTIYQFEHKQGLVQKIEEDSEQLTKALISAVPIIITTLQKFPFVTRQLERMAEKGQVADAVLPTRKIAVIVDEAHSSQSGESATELKGVLGGADLLESAKAQALAEGHENIEELYKSMAQRSQQANLSFFAFTATPKHKTLKIFGRDGEAFHRYTMRQAIEEGFIMDVLQHYVTYRSFFKLLKASEDDPNVERKQAARALARFMSLHPYNIAQKTEVMVEHFYQVTRLKIGGQAKAMVVTSSRLAAVRYKQAFDDYIKKKNYPIRSLVAFSGTVQDDQIPTITYTEVEMNGIRESEVPEKFGSPEYQVLLVAEKYQTGFDQPLLHTLYIDKRLDGIQAVQTLSRLNRIHPLKEDTFILDFVNDRDDIRDAFKTFYEGAEIGEEADPQQLYQIKADLDESGIYLLEEVEAFTRIYFMPKEKQNSKDHAAMNAILSPVVERFKALQETAPEEAELWRGKLASFRNLYAFLSQIIPYQDSDLEQLYVFVRHLSAVLPRRASLRYDFDNDVRLQYYRLQKIEEGSIKLKDGDARKLDGPTEVGTAQAEEDKVKLSEVVTIINERFGTDFTAADQLFFDQIISDALQSDELKQSARVNSPDKFALLFTRLLQDLFIARIDQNEAIFSRYMGDENFKSTVAELLGQEVYERLQEGS